jgi:hypothetical protein
MDINQQFLWGNCEFFDWLSPFSWAFFDWLFFFPESLFEFHVCGKILHA